MENGLPAIKISGIQIPTVLASFFVKTLSCLFFFRKKSSNSDSSKGEIIHVDPVKCYGFIRAHKTGQKIYFQLRFVVNCSDENVVLYNGLVVNFDLPLNKESGEIIRLLRIDPPCSVGDLKIGCPPSGVPWVSWLVG